MQPVWLRMLPILRNTWKLTIEKSLTNVPGVTSHVTRLAEGKAQWLNIWKSMDSSKNASAGCKDIIQQKPSPSQSQEDHKKIGPTLTRCSTWWGNWEWVSATGTKVHGRGVHCCDQQEHRLRCPPHRGPVFRHQGASALDGDAPDFELKDPKKNINYICQVSTSKLDLSGYCFFLF